LAKQRSTTACKSAGMSGVNCLLMVTLSSTRDGNRSSGTVWRSGSGLGNGVPLSKALV
jgi:hypothetical protein